MFAVLSMFTVNEAGSFFPSDLARNIFINCSSIEKI